MPAQQQQGHESYPCERLHGANWEAWSKRMYYWLAEKQLWESTQAETGFAQPIEKSTGAVEACEADVADALEKPWVAWQGLKTACQAAVEARPEGPGSPEGTVGRPESPEGPRGCPERVPSPEGAEYQAQRGLRLLWEVVSTVQRICVMDCVLEKG